MMEITQTASLHMVSQAEIIQACVQAPGETPPPLHPLFRRPEGEEVILTPEYIWNASQFPPYERLPRSFAHLVSWPPSSTSGSCWEPPTFHFGWRPNVKFMLDIARQHGLTVTRADAASSWLVHYPNIFRPQPRDVRCLNELDFDESGNSLLPKYETEVLWPPVDALLSRDDIPRTIDVYETITATLREMLREARVRGIVGDWCATLDIALTLRVDDGNNFVVAIMNSYNHLALWHKEDMPRLSIDDMCVLKTILGVSGPPMWYVDRDRFQWLKRSRRGHQQGGRG